MLWNKFRQTWPAYFLFAFNDKFDVDGQTAVTLEQRLHCFDMGKNLPLIIRCAACVEVIIADGWLKGGAEPKVKWFGRLHIVMAVNEHGGRARCVQPIGINQGMAGCGDDTAVLQANGRERRHQPFGRPLHIGRVFRLGADAGDA